MEDFDRYWRQTLSKQIESRAGAAARESILPDHAGHAQPDEELPVLDWTREVLDRMENTLDIQTCREVMLDCACQYPEKQLEPLRRIYECTGDLQQVHTALLEQFESFLRETLKLEEAMIADVVTRGWGSAGILERGHITAIKIPKSAFLKDYLQEDDAEVRRAMYCHCPRVRDVVGAGKELPRLYCYCGAGFYKHMWETILQEPVQVEVLESVLSGGEVCKIAVCLRAGD